MNKELLEKASLLNSQTKDLDGVVTELKKEKVEGVYLYKLTSIVASLDNDKKQRIKTLFVEFLEEYTEEMENL